MYKTVVTFITRSVQTVDAFIRTVEDDFLNYSLYKINFSAFSAKILGFIFSLKHEKLFCILAVIPE